MSRWTIGARIIAIVLALAVPLNLVIVAVVWHLAEVASETQRTSLLYTAQSVAATVDAKLGEYIALAKVLGSSPALLDGNLAAFDAEARRAFASAPDAWVLVADLNGQQLINTASRPGQSLPLRSPVAMPAQKRAFDTRSILVTGVLMPPVGGDWIVNIETPVFKDGKPFQALAVCIKARSFLRLLNDRRLPANWIAAIADRQGLMITRAPGDERYAGQPASAGWRQVKDREGVFEIGSLEGDPVVLANAHSVASGWAAGVAVKKAEMQGAVWSTIRWATIAGGGLSVLSLLLAGAVARRITRPIAELQEKASGLLVNHVPATPPAGPPEVSSLWEALKQSAADRDRSDQAFRESEARLHLALDAAELGTWRWDAGKVTKEMHWDARCRALFGLLPNTPVTYEVWANSIPPEDRIKAEANVARALDPADPHDETVCEYRVRHPDGVVRWLSSVGRAFFELDPAALSGRRAMFMAGAIRDVTEAYLAEASRRERERHDRYFLELDGRLREAVSAREAIDTACEALGQELGASFAGLGELQPDEEHTFVESAWSAGELAPPSGRYRLADSGAKQIAALLAGGAVTITDVLTSPYTAGDAAARAIYAAHGIRSSIGVALLRNGPRAFLFVANAAPRAWIEAEAALVRGTLDRAWHAVERARAEEAVRESEERLRLSNEAAGIGPFTIDVDTGCVLYPQETAAMLGVPNIGKISLEAAFSRVHRDDVARVRSQYEAALKGTGKGPLKVDFRYVRLGGDVCWIAWTGRVDFRDGPNGRLPYRVAGACVEITERKHQEEQIKLLMAEVNHRSKNMLAVVQSIARQTAATKPHDFIERFGERIRALAASQDLLVENDWKGVDLAELVCSQLAHFKDLIGTRINLKGSQVLISPSAAQTIGMALHELATNAGKFGALSNRTGRVEVEWSLNCVEAGEETFTMSWRETGGPPVKAPERRGFGSAIIGSLAESSLCARVELDFPASGLSWRLHCPAKEIVDGSGSALPQS
ncbi:MAG: HWE histidine kinase domain-containing protein [Rhodomicrobium sp.]